MELFIESRFVEDEFVTLEVRVASKEVEALERGAYLVVAQRNGIDITTGEAPRTILERALGEEKASEAMLEALKNFVAPFALSLEGGDYSVVGAPLFDEGKRLDGNGDLLLKATWVRLPALPLSSYDPVEITVPVVKVSEEDVDARVEEVAESYKTIERDVSRSKVEDGAIVLISMECLKDGERFDQLCFKERPYRAGSAQMPAGFDEALDGARVGQTVHVDFLLPVQEDIYGEMSGPAITAEVKVEAIMREVGRVMTDEFVRDNIPNLNGLADLREQCRKELVEGQSAQMRHYRNFLAAAELAKRVEGAISDSAYEAVANQMMESLREQARAERISIDELLEAQGSSEQQYRMMVLMQARTQLRQGAALDAWARHRGLVVTEEDLDAFFASSAKGEAAAAMREEIESGGYRYLAREGALRLKASEDVLACAIVHEDDSLEMPLG